MSPEGSESLAPTTTFGRRTSKGEGLWDTMKGGKGTAGMFADDKDFFGNLTLTLLAAKWTPMNKKDISLTCKLFQKTTSGPTSELTSELTSEPTFRRNLCSSAREKIKSVPCGTRTRDPTIKSRVL